MVFLIMGPQGSGKGTQAKRLAQELGYFYFDAGARLRKIAKDDARINEIVNKRGELLPDDEIFEIVTSALSEKRVYDNMILDGYPRSITQYELISKWLSDHNSEITKAIFLEVSEEVSIARLSARRQDPKTGKIYNLITKKPGGDVDINSLIHREDDKPKAIRERLMHYHKTTEPLVNKLRQQDRLIEVDGERGIEEIYEDISKIIKEQINAQNAH
jgi:adenylate kinase